MPDHRSLKPGTILACEHEGELHRVIVIDEGFAWNGATYTSLSEVARAITGTNWNGPRFFGLRDKAKPWLRRVTLETIPCLPRSPVSLVKQPSSR